LSWKAARLNRLLADTMADMERQRFACVACPVGANTAKAS
jgi:hypothetical protein